MTDDVLRMFTIYERPLDYTDGYVVRGCSVYCDGSGRIEHDRVAQYAQTLAEARGKVPTGLYRLPRNPDDEPQIVEVWI